MIARRICKNVFKRFYHEGAKALQGGEKKKVRVLGVPFELGQRKTGVAEAPQILRENGLLQDLEDLNFDVKDCGDITYDIINTTSKVENMICVNEFGACAEKVSQRVESIIKNKRICLTLGGDHAIAVGTIDGHLKAVGEQNIAVLWVDAHSDMNTHTTSYSGNIHGMPVGLLAKDLKNDWPQIDSLSWLYHQLPLNSFAYIGLRSVDNDESDNMDKYGVTRYTMDDVERLGIHSVVDQALRKIDPLGNKSIHVSFDIDALDPLEAPSTGTAVRGGLTLREGLHIMETVYQTGRLKGIDLVEVNPRIGDSKDVARTLEAARYLILAAFGHSRRGYNYKQPLY